MAALIDDLQQILQHVTDELATEVSREQQHLMLMQDQVMARVFLNQLKKATWLAVSQGRGILYERSMDGALLFCYFKNA